MKIFGTDNEKLIAENEILRSNLEWSERNKSLLEYSLKEKVLLDIQNFKNSKFFRIFFFQNKEFEKLNNNYFKLKNDYDELMVSNLQSRETIEKEVFFILIIQAPS